MKILLVDDHSLFREGMRYVLQQLPEQVEIFEASNFPDALKQAELHPDLDLALLDLNMPGSEGPISVKFFHQRFPHIPVVVVSGEDGRINMEKVMSHGAMGFVCKSSSRRSLSSVSTMSSYSMLIILGGASCLT
ncbi:MAG: response regulator, partial [Gallionella sp.]